jgi:uncharacterized membrane protein YdjX (TVP38/TMEM64 family)
MSDALPRPLSVLLALVGYGLPAVAVCWFLVTNVSIRDIEAWLAPHRAAWYALPLVMGGFVVLAPLPVLLLIIATGVVFGPILGPIYAMAGCLASASAAFAVGRRVGRARVERWGGERAARLTATLRRNGTLAVFLVRKVPAPFALVNLVIGASSIPYRDFLIGTTLGMGAIVIGLAGVGHQVTEIWRNPTGPEVARAGLVFAVALTAAFLINRAMQRSGHGDDRPA